MTTAIIVSGALRHLVNASSSWNIPGDYHLVIDSNLYKSGSTESLGSVFTELNNNINNCFVKFTSVNVCIDNKLENKFDEKYKIDPIINMIWKWKCAYHIIQPYHQIVNYDRILIIRPDLFFHNKKPIEELEKIELRDNTISAVRTLNNELGVCQAPDTCLLMNMQTFGILSTFYDYCVTTHGLGMNDLHGDLAKFLIANNVTVDDRVWKILTFILFRRNVADHMFENGRLKKEYSIFDIWELNKKWWKDLSEKGIEGI
jgi:hypothetical protein